MLVDEFHFIVSILECPSCSQLFVSVLTEIVDWVGGDDSQYWTLMPITAAEAVASREQGDSLSEAKLAALGAGRRSLHRDYPTGEAQRIYWSAGT